MRTIRNSVAGALVLAVAATLAAPAVAGGLYRDRVHADSFGNLVIYSPSGYKRIIVGMGEAADGYNTTGSYYEPEIVYNEHQKPRYERHHHHGELHCHRPPVLLHGRSYMYGLPDNVIPVPAGLCP